jgi:hypothetical protein
MPPSKRRVQLAKARQKLSAIKQAERTSTRSQSNRDQTITPQLQNINSLEELLQSVSGSEELQSFDISECPSFDQVDWEYTSCDETDSDVSDSDDSSHECSADELGENEFDDEVSGGEMSSDTELELEVTADETEVGVDTTVNRPEYKLEWKENAGKSLKRPYGSGSERTMKRRRKHQRELEQAAANTRNIVDIFKQQQGLKAPAKRAGRSSQQLRLEKLNRALDDLDRLIKSSKVQVRTYGHIVVSEGDFDRRHRMVRAFLHRQKNKDRNRSEMAMEVAKAFGRSKPTARNIIKWEKEWIAHRRLPESKAGKHRACLSLLDDEGILCAIQDFTKTQGDGKCSTTSERRLLLSHKLMINIIQH